MKKTFLCIVFLVTCSGCSIIKEYVPVYPKLIMIHKPGKPQYEKVEFPEGVKPTDREKKLIRMAHGWQVYSKQLELGIDKYNEVAEKHNEEYKKYFKQFKDGVDADNSKTLRHSEVGPTEDPKPIKDDEFSY